MPLGTGPIKAIVRTRFGESRVADIQVFLVVVVALDVVACHRHAERVPGGAVRDVGV